MRSSRDTGTDTHGGVSPSYDRTFSTTNRSYMKFTVNAQIIEKIGSYDTKTIASVSLEQTIPIDEFDEKKIKTEFEDGIEEAREKIERQLKEVRKARDAAKRAEAETDED